MARAPGVAPRRRPHRTSEQGDPSTGREARADARRDGTSQTSRFRRWDRAAGVDAAVALGPWVKPPGALLNAP